MITADPKLSDLLSREDRKELERKLREAWPPLSRRPRSPEIEAKLEADRAARQLVTETLDYQRGDWGWAEMVLRRIGGPKERAAARKALETVRRHFEAAVSAEGFIQAGHGLLADREEDESEAIADALGRLSELFEGLHDRAEDAEEELVARGLDWKPERSRAEEAEPRGRPRHSLRVAVDALADRWNIRSSDQKTIRQLKIALEAHFPAEELEKLPKTLNDHLGKTRRKGRGSAEIP